MPRCLGCSTRVDSFLTRKYWDKLRRVDKDKHSSLPSLTKNTVLYCQYPEWRYAECHYSECRYSECRYAKCRYAECRYAECHYAEWRYAECHLC